MQDNQERLQAFLAHAGVASRRASEKIILEGRVSVNGATVTELGTKVGAGDKVCVDGKQVFAEAAKRYETMPRPHVNVGTPTTPATQQQPQNTQPAQPKQKRSFLRRDQQ